jgi:hypothetical protein
VDADIAECLFFDLGRSVTGAPERRGMTAARRSVRQTGLPFEQDQCAQSYLDYLTRSHGFRSTGKIAVESL